MPQEDPNSDFRVQVRKLRDCLQKVDFLYQLKLEELDKLMAALKKRRYPAGFTVIKQGDPGDAFFMISSGRVAILEDGKKVTSRRPGEYFGDSALVTDSPRSATVVTEEETELYILYKTDFTKILMANPGIGAAIKAHVAKLKK
jgi:cAMP-dependent protein kinase regulator